MTAFAIVAAMVFTAALLRGLRGVPAGGARVIMASSSSRSAGGGWSLPPEAEPYRAAIAAAERRHDMPPRLLGRLLWQESRFRPDIISGETVSPAGAVGIAQIVPRWHPDVNPLDPFASIDYAAAYLARLKNQFGGWDRALAAYNWGPGNLQAALNERGDDWLALAPRETRAYVSQIIGDVPVVPEVWA